MREIDLKTDQNFFELDFIKLGNDWRNSLFLRATRDFKERRRFLKFSQWFGRLDFFAFLLAVSFLLNRWRISLSNQGGDPRLLTTFVGICRETVLMKLSLHFCQATSICLNPEFLLHVVAGCNSYLNRFTWRHDSVLNFIANIVQPMNFNNLYVDLPGFLIPSIVTGDKYRPDLLLTTKDNCLYILELTVGYETNLRNNIIRKQEKYTDVIKEQKKHFMSVEFINLSISALGVFDKESSAFLKMLNRLDVSETQTKYYIKKIINICIRSTYYIFCCRNKEWTNPDLMKF